MALKERRVPRRGITAGPVAGGESLIVERSFEDMEREILARLRRYELRYEMSSEKMADLQEHDRWPETAEISTWMVWYRALKSLKR